MKKLNIIFFLIFFAGITNNLKAFTGCPTGVFVNQLGQSVITVTSANDPLNPFEANDPLNCDHTLRWAINIANTLSNSLIIFDIPGNTQHIIYVNSSLPTINKPCIIDGTTQAGYIKGNPIITIDDQYFTSNVLCIFPFYYSLNQSIKGLKILSNFSSPVFAFFSTNFVLEENVIISNPASVSLINCDNSQVISNSIFSNNVCIDIAGSNNIKIGSDLESGKNVFSHEMLGVRISSHNYYSTLYNSNYINLKKNVFLKTNSSVGYTRRAILLDVNNNFSKQKPIINSISTFANITGTSDPNDRVELFGSTGPENANVYLTTVYANSNGQWSADLSSNTYNYVSATATDANGNTSELAISMNVPCPKVIFKIPNYECGDLNFSDQLHVCNSYNWSLNHVEWHVGNNVINTPDLNLNYQFPAASYSYNINATAFFTDPFGNTCSATAHTPINYHEYDINMSLTDIQLCEGNPTNTNLTIAVPDIDASLSINNNGAPLVANTPYNIIFQYTTSNQSMLNSVTSSTNPTFTVKVDGVIVQTGTYSTFPASGSIVLNHSFSPGSHVVEYEIDYTIRMCDLKYVLNINFEPPPCDSCVNFVPEIGKRYWVSGWVKENHTIQQINYSQSKIEIEFLNGSNIISTVSFLPSGGIIDEWQRIVGDFVVPSNTTDISINLVNDNINTESFFDDIRIHPFNASMKSYVYDPVTFLLKAELDDNNYATFYEYDSENQLIGIKKETARGIVTIQEGRTNLQKP